MKKIDVLTIGGATQDIIYYSDDFELINNKSNILKQKLLALEYGAKIISNDVYMDFGGGGMNTAVSFANLGLKTATILNLGQDWIGELIIKELRKKRIDFSLVSQSKNIYSGFSFIMSNKKFNEHVILGHRGANDKLKINKNILSKINSKWIYLASLSGADTLVKSNIKNIFNIKDKNKNVSLAWNPGNAQLKYSYLFFKKYLSKLDFLSLNKDEAIELVLSFGLKTNNISRLLKTIHSWGAKIVAITDSKKGASIYDGKKIYFKEALKNKKVVNTTGAGDAFASSFVAGLLMYKNDIEKSFKLAMYRSNSVISKIGAQNGLLKKSQIKNIK